MLNFDWISHIDMNVAKLLMLLAFIGPLVFTLTLKKSYIFAGTSDTRLFKNLKIWIALLTAIMLVVYWSF